MTLRSTPVKPTRLPDALKLAFTFQKGMPHSWQNWLRDLTYWHGSLDED